MTYKAIEDYTHLTATQHSTECGETATLPEIVHVTFAEMVDCPDCLDIMRGFNDRDEDDRPHPSRSFGDAEFASR